MFMIVQTFLWNFVEALADDAYVLTKEAVDTASSRSIETNLQS